MLVAYARISDVDLGSIKRHFLCQMFQGKDFTGRGRRRTAQKRFGAARSIILLPSTWTTGIVDTSLNAAWLTKIWATYTDCTVCLPTPAGSALGERLQ